MLETVSTNASSSCSLSARKSIRVISSKELAKSVDSDFHCSSSLRAEEVEEEDVKLVVVLVVEAELEETYP